MDVLAVIVVTSVNVLLVRVKELLAVAPVCAKDVTDRLVSVPRISVFALRRVLVARESVAIVSRLRE